MKATLNVPGVDPARIECHTAKNGRQLVHAFGYPVASLCSDGGVSFYGNYSDSIRANCQKVMNAAIDHWRQTGRLFPEPPPEPVECVCGGKPSLCSDGSVWCHTPETNFCFRAPDIASWNIAMNAVKAAKK